MKYELAATEKLIDQLSPEQLRKEPPEEVQFQKWVQIMTEEAARVRNSMIEQVINNKDSQASEAYVEAQQKGLIALANTLHAYRTRSQELQPINPSLAEFYKELCKIIEQQTSFIIRLFSKYFEDSLDISIPYATVVRKELLEKYEAIRRMYDQLPEVNADLFSIALKPLHEFVTGEHLISYQRVGYLRDLVDQLLLLPVEDAAIDNLVYNYQLTERELFKIDMPEARLNVKLHISLLYLNHNSQEYIGFCVANLQRKMEMRDDAGFTILYLRSYAKMLKQLRLKPGSRLDPDRKSTRQQILDWIIVELDFQETLQQLRQPEPHDDDTDDPIAATHVNKTMEKLAMKMNVGKLVYLFRVLKELELIDDSASNIVRFLIRHFKTEGADDISYASAYNQYFNQKTATIDFMEKLFRLATAQIRKRY